MPGGPRRSRRRPLLALPAFVLPACSVLGSLDDLQGGTISNARDAGDDASLDASELDAAEDVLVVDVSCTGWCTLPNALASCADGSCAISACNAPYEDCDLLDNTGCEANTSSSSSHCGGCNQPCNAPDGSAQCTNGQCVVDCPAGFEDCNGDPNDGCEALLDWDGEHCGSCTNSCVSGEACTNGGCTSSECAPTQGLLKLRPNADVDTGLWAAVPGPPFFEQIDETSSQDGTTSFVWDDTAAAPSEAIFEATQVTIPSGRGVASVILSAWARLNPSATEASDFWLIVRVGSDDQNASVSPISTTSWVRRTKEWTSKPDAGTPWTQADLDSIHIGFSHQKPSSTTNPVEVTKLLLEACLGPP